MDSILPGGIHRERFRLSCAALGPLQIAREPRIAEVSKGAIVNKMLENEKKRGRERKVVVTGLVRAEVYDRQESERRQHLVGLEAFTRNISLTKNIRAAS